jgi:hypothetical protein
MRDATAMLVAINTVDAATTPNAPVLDAVAVNAPTGGTVRAGGAMTGGRGSTEAPALGDGDCTDVCAGGAPPARGTVSVPGCDDGRGDVDGVLFGEGVGAGGGVPPGDPFVQQCPSPW